MDENAAHHVVPENVPVRVVCRKDASICDLTATKGETGTHRTVDISTALLSWYFLHVRRRRKRGMYVKEGRNLQVAPVKQAHFVINSEARNARSRKPFEQLIIKPIPFAPTLTSSDSFEISNHLRN